MINTVIRREIFDRRSLYNFLSYNHLTHVVVGRGEAVRVVNVVGADVVGHGGKEGDETDGNESLAREVTLSPVNLLWWVGVELALKKTSTNVSQTSHKNSLFSAYLELSPDGTAGSGQGWANCATQHI